MKSSNNPRIISGDAASIKEKVVFCSPEGHIKPIEDKADHNLKSLETYWKKEGFEKGKEEGFQEGYQEGLKVGKKEGLEEGEKIGFDKGRTQGIDEGKKEVSSSYEEIFQKGTSVLEKVGHCLKDFQDTVYKKGKEEVTEILVALTKEILKQKIKEAPIFEKLLISLLNFSRTLIKKAPVEIFLSSHDFQSYKEASEKFSPQDFGAETLEFYEDVDLVAGAIRIVAPTGLLRYDLNHCLEEIHNKLISSIYKDAENSITIEKDLDELLAEFPWKQQGETQQEGSENLEKREEQDHPLPEPAPSPL